MAPQVQTALSQTPVASSTSLPLVINNEAPVPKRPSEHHVLVRVLAVALNPNDHKMMTHFNMPGNPAGCDFCGIVEEATESSRFGVGTRVSGALFPYNPDNPDNGAFSQWIVVDSRLLVKVPENWTDFQAASLGVGWSTLSLSFSDPNALGLEGFPSSPTEKNQPVLVYGAATATGTMACQLLNMYVNVNFLSLKALTKFYETQDGLHPNRHRFQQVCVFGLGIRSSRNGIVHVPRLCQASSSACKQTHSPRSRLHYRC